MPSPIAVEVVLSEEEREQLESWARRRSSARALAQRSRIVLAAAEGLKNTEVAERLWIDRATAAKWRSRFAAQRLQGLLDEPRPGRPRTITDAQVEELVIRTPESTPKDATHWSTRSLAAQVGLTQSAVSRIWRAFGLQPHRQQTWQLSRDGQFVAKVRDVVGLYLDPPERAVVLCVDVKSQIQALDRTTPILPMLPGTPERATHDYTRQPTVATRPPPLRPAFHPDQLLVAEPRRAPVLRAHEQEATSRDPPLRQPAQLPHPRLVRHLQRKPTPLLLDQDSRADPRIRLPLLHMNQRLTTLGVLPQLVPDRVDRRVAIVLAARLRVECRQLEHALGT